MATTVPLCAGTKRPSESVVQKYLNSHFPVDGYKKSSGCGWDDKKLTRHFFTTFGCNLWIEAEFYLIKYEVHCEVFFVSLCCAVIVMSCEDMFQSTGFL